MGHAGHRIEVLLVGVVLLLSGVLVAMVLLVRPASHEVRGSAPTAEVRAAPLVPGPPLALPAGALVGAAVFVGGALGGLVLVRRRRRRLGYTNQTLRQFLVVANPETRASTLRVLRDLARRGVLTPDLASIAGRSAHPMLRWWRAGWVVLRLPLLRWLRQPQACLWLCRSVAAVPERLAQVRHWWNGGGFPRRGGKQGRASVRIESVPCLAAPDTHASLGCGRAEERVQSVAQALMVVWEELALRSTIQAFDTRRTAGRWPVRVVLDVHPADEVHLARVPEVVTARCPTWRVVWRGAQLVIALPAEQPCPPIEGPLLVPILAHGRQGRLTRWLPLQQWPHLGLVGPYAYQALHALLVSVLYAQPPDRLALTILDRGTIAPLYREVAHLVLPPHEVQPFIEQLTHRVRRAPLPRSGMGIRPTMLVIIAPDAALWERLTVLLTRLRACPDVPLHLVVVHEALAPEQATHLPMLFTGEHQQRARLAASGMRLAGQALTQDETTLPLLLAALRAAPATLPPTLWEDQPVVRAVSDAGSAPQPADVCVPAVDADSTDWLERLITDGNQPSAVCPTPPPAPLVADVDDGDWPDGPAPLGSVALAAVMQQIVTDTALSADVPTGGLTKNRVAALLVTRHALARASARPVAEVLLVWLDGAGLLVPGRLRHPRPLRTTDLAMIAAHLRATPMPAPAVVAAAWATADDERKDS